MNLFMRVFLNFAPRITKRKNTLASPVTMASFMDKDAGLKELGGAEYLARLAASAIGSFCRTRLCTDDLQSSHPARIDTAGARHQRARR